jgi:imidazolonepropionase-like amidohydrolase
MTRLAAIAFALTAALGAPPTLIRNANVITVTKGSFYGSILIRDGKIAALGPDVAAPEGATVIDAAGQYVMPGIIDPHSHIAAESVNEGSISVSSMVAIEDVLDPEDIDIYRALAGGVTTAAVLHGSANAIGGQCSVIKMRWGRDARGILFEGARPILKMALGENPKRRGAIALCWARRRRAIPPRGWEWKTSSARRSPRRGSTASAGASTRPSARAARRRCRRGGTSSWSRWWRCSRAGGWFTRTATAPTRSS